MKAVLGIFMFIFLFITLFTAVGAIVSFDKEENTSYKEKFLFRWAFLSSLFCLIFSTGAFLLLC